MTYVTGRLSVRRGGGVRTVGTLFRLEIGVILFLGQFVIGRIPLLGAFDEGGPLVGRGILALATATVRGPGAVGLESGQQGASNTRTYPHTKARCFFIIWWDGQRVETRMRRRVWDEPNIAAAWHDGIGWDNPVEG